MMEPTASNSTVQLGESKLELPMEYLREFCQRHHIRKLALFGSAQRGELRPDSDIDLLVEFKPESIPGLYRLADMEFELEEILAREVEMRTPKDISRYFRDEVVRSATVLYEERS